MISFRLIGLIATLLFALLVMVCALTGCGRKDDSEDQPTITMKQAQAERDLRCQRFDEKRITRCDRVTFVGLKVVACGGDELAKYESPEGKWNRDIAACHPNDSVSPCSRDGYLSVLLDAAGRADHGVAQRMATHLANNDYLCGEGPEDTTDLTPLKWAIEKLSSQEAQIAGIEITNPLEGFRGHLLATGIWLHARLYGGISIAEKAALALLVKEVPESPYYRAMYSRFVSGNPQQALAALAQFPAPYDRWWGSADDDVIYAASVAVLEGK